MTPRWQDVRCASIPVDDLSVLADLRREPGIRVTIAGAAPGSAGTMSRGARRRPGGSWSSASCRWPGVEIFAQARWPLASAGRAPAGLRRADRRRFGGRRAGSSDPAPADDGGAARTRRPPHRSRSAWCATTDGRPRPAAAVRCRLDRLAAWAERAPSSLDRVALRGLDPGPREAGRARPRCCCSGPAARLPVAEDGLRFWGVDVLIPLGYRAEPELAEPALRARRRRRAGRPGRPGCRRARADPPPGVPAPQPRRHPAGPGRDGGRDARPRRPRS